MTERIRWERIDGTVTSWFGYVGSHKGPLFQILHPVASKPDARTQFHKWALAATFAQDEVRYPETAEGAQAALKDEAEEWLAEHVSSLGAIFPEEHGEMFADVTDEEAYEEEFRARYAPGRRVRYAHPGAGYLADQEMAFRHLTPGEVYVIEWSDIGFSSSRLGLAGIKDRAQGFNSVLFEPVPDETTAAMAARDEE